MEKVICENEEGYFISKKKADSKLKKYIPFLKDKKIFEINSPNNNGDILIVYLDKETKKINEGVFEKIILKTIIITSSKFNQIFKMNSSKRWKYIRLFQKKHMKLFRPLTFSFIEPQNDLFYFFREDKPEPPFRDDVPITPIKKYKPPFFNFKHITDKLSEKNNEDLQVKINKQELKLR